jgi:predicted AlkP superfamily phosphohydrolase/phosphomutase
MMSGMSGSRRNKVLLLGLDSADGELIERWCAEGHLPNMAKLRSEGLWSGLRTTAEVMHVSAWPTIYTGTLPGKHGMYHAYQVRAGEQGIHRTRAEECAQPPFWKYLDDAGRKCIVMDAFMDYRLEGFQGIQIVEYGTWTWFTTPSSTPSGIYKEIVSKFGKYPAPEHTQVLNVPEPREFRDRLIKGAAVKADVARWLLEAYPWDMCFLSFGEPHASGHFLWHVEDTTYPSHPSEGIDGLEFCMRETYAAVDEAIGRIVDNLDDSVTVMITSGDGMGPNYSGCHLIPDLLHNMDLFHSAHVGAAADESKEKPRKGLLSSIREAIPLSVRHSISRCLPHDIHYRLSMKWANSGIDWSRSRAFCIPNANEAYVRVNKHGREPQGIVSGEQSYRNLIDMLDTEFQALTNPANGRSSTHRIYDTDQVFPGSLRDNLPDLVVTWDPEAKVLAELESPAAGRVCKQAGYQTAPYYSGNHRPNAFVLARGPRISRGSGIDGGHIVDIAPTIMEMLGVEPPKHFDGRAWQMLSSS